MARRSRAGHPLGAAYALAVDHACYLEEIIEVLAAQSPDLRQALEHAQRAGLPHLILDGTVIDTDRVHTRSSA